MAKAVGGNDARSRRARAENDRAVETIGPAPPNDWDLNTSDDLAKAIADSKSRRKALEEAAAHKRSDFELGLRRSVMAVFRCSPEMADHIIYVLPLLSG